MKKQNISVTPKKQQYFVLRKITKSKPPQRHFESTGLWKTVNSQTVKKMFWSLLNSAPRKYFNQ